MNMGAQRQPLSGSRWHFQHGPIDLIIGADGDAAAVAAAHEAAWVRFSFVLAELVEELPKLRQPMRHPVMGSSPPFQGRIAQRMAQACAPFAGEDAQEFITPMAAVAGAVAQEIIAFYQRRGIRRAWVNNGGDIALHLADGESLRIGLFADLSRLDASLLCQAIEGELPIDGRMSLHADDGIRGVATSGWRGRSHSLGIADSVTVLAATAAEADAAATMIANAVDIDDAIDAPRIERRPANELRDDSDLGVRLVTVNVPTLSASQRHAALRAGAECAEGFRRRGLIVAAALVCQGEMLQVGSLASSRSETLLVQ